MLEEWKLKIFLEIEGMGIYMSIPEVEKRRCNRIKRCFARSLFDYDIKEVKNTR